MKVIVNTLRRVYRLWEDPGEYPSGAAGSPLKPEIFLSEVEGYVELMYPSEVGKIFFVENYSLEDILDYARYDFTELLKTSTAVAYGDRLRERPEFESSPVAVLDGVRFDNDKNVYISGHFACLN